MASGTPRRRRWRPTTTYSVNSHLNRGAAEATAAAVEERGGNAVLHGCDISDPAASAALIDAATDAFGRLVSPEEVAEAIRFFATTTSISGRTVTVNGGWNV